MKRIDLLKIISYVYIVLPVIIFLLGWTRLSVIGVPVTVAIIFCLYRMISDAKIDFNSDAHSIRTIFKVLVIVLIIAIWVYFSGVGCYVWQNADHRWRNEIFNILVEYRWPVVKGTASGANGMSYYIGFWMVPALMGKVFGIEAGYFTQYIWACIGVLLAYFLICRRIDKIAIWPVIVFILFSGQDIIGLLIKDYDLFLKFHLGTHIETWAYGYQFSSFTTQLFWVYNQAIYGWIITLLLIEEKNRNMVILMAAGLLSSPLSMLGLFPIALCVIWNNSLTDDRAGVIEIFRKGIKSLITYENAVGFVIAGIIGSMYLGNNAIKYTASAGQSKLIILIIIAIILFIILGSVLVFRKSNSTIKKVHAEYPTNKVKRLFKGIMLLVGIVFIVYGANNTIPTKNYITKDNNLISYLGFLCIEIGIYILLTYKKGKSSNVYISSIVMFLLCPIFVIGSSIDFCMRVCIPAQIILFIYILLGIKEIDLNRDKLYAFVLVAALLIGSVTTISEFSRTINNYPEYKEKGVDIARNEEIMESMNFCSKVDDSIFYKYFSRY